jgi:hypothetical protein
MSQQLAIALYTASTWVIPLIVAITFHEASLMGASMSASGQKLTQWFPSSSSVLAG